MTAPWCGKIGLSVLPGNRRTAGERLRQHGYAHRSGKRPPAGPTSRVLSRRGFTCSAGSHAMTADGDPLGSYPSPSSPAVTRSMRGSRRVDSLPERRLRSELHRRGLRFCKDLLLRIAELGVRPDIVFTRRHLAVFVDGCFWHSCPEHSTTPQNNASYWSAKFARNVARDRAVNCALTEVGWIILRIWEHTPVPEAADAVSRVLDTSA